MGFTSLDERCPSAGPPSICKALDLAKRASRHGDLLGMPAACFVAGNLLHLWLPLAYGNYWCRYPFLPTALPFACAQLPAGSTACSKIYLSDTQLGLARNPENRGLRAQERTAKAETLKLEGNKLFAAQQWERAQVTRDVALQQWTRASCTTPQTWQCHRTCK